MSIDSHGARLSRRDVVELATSSEQLAVVSGMIRSSGVKWGEVAVNLLIVVNNNVVRIQSKGARAFARYLEKYPPQSAEAPAEVPDWGDAAKRASESIPDEDEEG